MSRGEVVVKFGSFEISIVRECSFLLDGGATFGVVPKALWNKQLPADQDNRVRLACNLLLIETAEGCVLVECGMGDRWSDSEIDRYGIETAVDRNRVFPHIANDDIDAVVISHLHFDHCGGAVRNIDGKLVPTFARAKHYVQKGEWRLAHDANARAKGSYRLDDFEPLFEHGLIEMIEGDTEILPGVQARVTGGHTSHHQVVCFESQGRKGVYFADIVPTKSHIQPAWVMGYDHYPLECCDVKSDMLARAARENWLVVFDHEPGVPWGHLSLNEKGRFAFEPLPEESLVVHPSENLAGKP